MNGRGPSQFYRVKIWGEVGSKTPSLGVRGLPLSLLLSTEIRSESQSMQARLSCFLTTESVRGDWDCKSPFSMTASGVIGTTQSVGVSFIESLHRSTEAKSYSKLQVRFRLQTDVQFYIYVPFYHNQPHKSYVHQKPKKQNHTNTNPNLINLPCYNTQARAKAIKQKNTSFQAFQFMTP